MVGEDLSEAVTLELRREGVNIWEMSISSTVNSMCKGPEVAVGLAVLRNSKEASMARARGAKEKPLEIGTQARRSLWLWVWTRWRPLECSEQGVGVTVWFTDEPDPCSQCVDEKTEQGEGERSLVKRVVQDPGKKWWGPGPAVWPRKRWEVTEHRAHSEGKAKESEAAGKRGAKTRERFWPFYWYVKMGVKLGSRLGSFVETRFHF